MTFDSKERATIEDALLVRALDRQADEYGDGGADAAADLYVKLTGRAVDEQHAYTDDPLRQGRPRTRGAR